MGNDSFVKERVPAVLSVFPVDEMLHVSAGPRALRMSSSDPENSDRDLQGARPLARSDGCDRSRRSRACIQPASLRPNVQRARVTGLFRKRRENGALASFHFFACLAEDGKARRLKFRRMLGHN